MFAAMVNSVSGRLARSLWNTDSDLIGSAGNVSLHYGKDATGQQKIIQSDVDGTDVVIPAWNNQVTLPDILDVMNAHPKICHVNVIVDAQSNDETTLLVMNYSHRSYSKVKGFYSEIHGKGQNVQAVVNLVHTPRVLFCDADYSGLTEEHLTEMTRYDNGMIIGIPQLPALVPDIPLHVYSSWPLVSGFRSCPRAMVPNNLHGYLMEVQLNHAAYVTGTQMHAVYFRDLYSPFRWPLTGERRQAMERDREWAQANLPWFKP